MMQGPSILPPPNIKGDWHTGELMRRIYATDASIYRALPQAVALPRDEADVQALVRYAVGHGVSLIPRAAGTSLAGQCVGEGIVVDTGRYMNRILEIDKANRQVRVQPGVIRDELNAALAPHGLFFGPNTSTANRAMIGGMVGNNSCGTTSIVYGSTRDHVQQLRVVLSDGSTATFGALSATALDEKRSLPGLEGQIYRQLIQLLGMEDIRAQLHAAYPKPSISRRNTGYALDLLAQMAPFVADGPPLNLCTLLCGSEGTLAMTTEITLSVQPLPPPEVIVVAGHFVGVDEALRATLVAMQHQPTACELMDKTILDLTRDNIAQQKNRFWVTGDPGAVLLVEFKAHDREQLDTHASQLVAAWTAVGLGYAFPSIYGQQTAQVWQLRNAGLGVLSNMPGDARAVACIEDTAVELSDLPSYIEEFGDLMAAFGQQSVYYAHAGAGELHLRPILNLKKSEDQQRLEDITRAVAELVKKYRGSLSGEHGDGRIRGAFIPLMLGEDNYQLLRQLKRTWDPQAIFNPGKITDVPPVQSDLRYKPDQITPRYDTIFDFDEQGGILRLAEKCNGSGDCRKLPVSGGTMCPSYHATRNEQDTTRARANALREWLSGGIPDNPFAQPGLKEVMDLCISCKGCTAECPSNVDMAALKAEWQYQYYKAHGIPLAARLFGHIDQLNALGMVANGLTNAVLSNRTTGSWLKKVLGIAPRRQLPTLHGFTLRQWLDRELDRLHPTAPVRGAVWLLVDEFTNYNDTVIGMRTVQLLLALGYEVRYTDHAPSGRALISKGLLATARRYARKNVALFSDKLSATTPLIGIEPSALLTFRDEYPRIIGQEHAAAAAQLAPHCLLIEEFLYREMQAGRITADQFTDVPKRLWLHGHCHQKALSDVQQSAWVLGLPVGHSVSIIPSGCCGMAGSFGYEARHYTVSMAIGEQVLFPAVRQMEKAGVVVASGTSCRHQIMDGTGRQALHPAEVLYAALRR